MSASATSPNRAGIFAGRQVAVAIQAMMNVEVRLNVLSWFWIALELTLPTLVGLLVAFPFWRKGGMIFGNIAATAVIFGSAFALIMKEYVDLDRMTRRCLDDGFVCWPDPSAFTRFAIYAFIGLVEVFVLFALSLVVETRMRRRDYAPAWRR